MKSMLAGAKSFLRIEKKTKTDIIRGLAFSSILKKNRARIFGHQDEGHDSHEDDRATPMLTPFVSTHGQTNGPAAREHY